MRAFGVVGHEPCVEIRLQRLDGLVQRLAQLEAEELVQHGAVEAFDKAIRLRPAHLGAAVHDVVEGKIQIVGVRLGAAEFPPIVGEHRRDRQAVGLVERGTSLCGTFTAASGCFEGCRKPKA